MDRNEQSLKIEELKTAMRGRDFEKAVEIAETFDIKKIKDNNVLSLIADAYELTHNYEQAKKTLLIAYENTDAGRHLAYRLCLVSTKMKAFHEAREFYEDFVEMAPRDTARYILKYKMAKAQGKPVSDLIKILEEYVNIDMEEKWAYELAKLYHMEGDEEKCVAMCDEISLWFAEGKYVTKALELKKNYRELSSSQQQQYEAGKMEKENKEILAPIVDESESPKEENKEEKESESGEKMEMEETEIDVVEKSNLQQTTKLNLNLKPADNPEEETEKNPEEETEEREKNPEEETNGPENIEETADNPGTVEDFSEKEMFEDILEEEISDPLPQEEQIHNIEDVQKILRQLQERGILQADTVQQAVNIIDKAGKISEEKEDRRFDDIEELEEENSEEEVLEEETVSEENISTLERWEEDNTPVKTQEKSEELSVEKELDEKTEEKETKEPENQTVSAETKIIPNVGDVSFQEADAEDEKKTKQIPAEEVTTVAKERKDNSVPPMFDLSLDIPQRDTSNDVGQKTMYESIVTNSELGKITDQLPTREEIEKAIQNAQLHIRENSSTKVEIISGVDDMDNVDKETSDTVEAADDISGEDKEESKETATDTETEDSSKANAEESKETSADTETETVSKGEETQTKEADHSEDVKTKGPGMTLTEQDLIPFKNYLNVEGLENNLRKIVYDLVNNYMPNGKSENGNIIIMGNDKTGKTTLALEIIKLVNKKRGRRGRRLAKIKAAALNRRGFRNSLNKLLGSDLIIENAHQLGVMTLSEMIDATGMFTDDMLIVLEGHTDGMETLLDTSSRMKQVFNHVIQIREYDIREWVEYGKQYAMKQGYGVDELANLAFYKAIDDFFGANKGIGQRDVENIVDQAISNSKKLGRKVKGIFSSQKDEDGRILLEESDFNI